MNMDEQCDKLNRPCIETVDMEVKVESDSEPTEIECSIATAKPDPNPEEGMTLTASTLVDTDSSLTTNAAYQSTLDKAMMIHEKYAVATEKGGSNNGEKPRPLQARRKKVTNSGGKIIPSQVKRFNIERVAKISKKKIATLLRKQKAGVPILMAMSKTHTLDPLIKCSEILKVSKPRKNLKILPKILLPLSKPFTVPSLSPQTGNIMQSIHSSIPAVNTPASALALPIISLPSPLTSPTPTISPQISTITTVNAVSIIQGVPTRTQNASFTTVRDVTQKDLSCTEVGPSAPLNTPRPFKINVLPKNLSIRRPFSSRLILPKPYINNKSVVCPNSAVNTPIEATSSVISPRSSEPNQYLLTEGNSASSKEIAPDQLKMCPPLFGGSVMLTETSQKGTASNQGLSSKVDASKTNGSSKMMMKFCQLQHLVTTGKYVPNLGRKVIIPMVRPDGSVCLEEKTVRWDKMGAEKFRSQSNFTLKEVSNNPLESGVAKKFVVSRADNVPISLCVKTVRSTASTSANTTTTVQSTTSTINTAKPVHSPTVGTAPVTDFLLSANSAVPVSDGLNSNKSSIQWLRPYTGDTLVALSTVDGPEIAGEDAPVSNSVDDGLPPPKISSQPPFVAGVPSINNGSVCISDNDDDLDTSRSTRPPHKNTENHPVMSIQLSSSRVEHSIENYLFSPEIGSIHSVPQSEAVNGLNSALACSSSVEGKIQWCQPCTGAEAMHSRDDSALNKNRTPRIQNDAPPVKFHTRERRYGPRIKIQTIKKKKIEKSEKLKMKVKKKKKKKKKKAYLNENAPVTTDPKTDIRKDVSSSSRPTSPSEVTDPLSVKTSSLSLGGISFQWHRPITDTNPENATDKSELVSNSDLKTEPVSLPESNEQQAHGTSLPGHGQGSENTEATFEPKYSPRSDPEASVHNEQDFLRVENDRIHSIPEAEGCATTSRPLKRTLVGGQDEAPQESRKKIRTSASNQHNELKGYISKLNKWRTPQKARSSQNKIGNSNVLRNCIVRKTIQDCYLEGVIPTIDKIHDACLNSGLELAKTSVEPHLISIGYKWVVCKSQKLLLEDYRSTAERIKYMNKLKKYADKNLVYIFVSEYVKRVPNDVKRPSLDAARVVLHAVSNNHLLEGGLEIVKVGLFGLRHNDIMSWLKCKVIPNIPQGSVVIFGHHRVFDKDEEIEERPNIVHSKEEIVSWLTSHKVTAVNPAAPKALLLCKVNRVILPKTSIFDELIRQNGFIPLHLPKHHMDLNPLEFIWQDILEKLHKTPDVISVDDLQDFVAQEFSSCSRVLTSVSCDLVRKFGCSYREFDSCSDELIEKLLSPTTSVTETARVAHTSSVTDATKVEVTERSSELKVVKTTPAKRTDGRRTGKFPLSTCPICLSTKRLMGNKCSMCKNFWHKLKHDYRFSHQTGKKLPVCGEITHIFDRPPDCLGCRRYRYEFSLFNQANIMKRLPSYVLPIPPVTEIGKKHWSKILKSRLKNSSNLSREDFQEDEEEN